MLISFKGSRRRRSGKLLPSMKVMAFAAFMIGALLCCVWPVAGRAQGQGPGSSEKKELRRREDSLKRLADKIVNSEDPSVRFLSDSQFVRVLVRSLKVRHSFYYPFDSL